MQALLLAFSSSHAWISRWRRKKSQPHVRPQGHELVVHIRILYYDIKFISWYDFRHRQESFSGQFELYMPDLDINERREINKQFEYNVE